MPRLSSRILAVTAAMTILLFPPPALAQAEWSRTTALGFATVGATIGLLGFMDDGYSAIVTVPIGLAGGAILGHVIGESAERNLESGKPLSPSHASAVRVGSVMAGAGLGAMAAAFMISSTQSSTVSDESLFATAVAGGTALGLLYQLLREEDMRPRPNVETTVGVSQEGAAVVGVRYTF